MTAAIFLVCAIAMMLAVGGRRNAAIALFALCLVASALWLDHHMTDPLALSF
jgi:Family of unknown function (DUF5993)